MTGTDGRTVSATFARYSYPGFTSTSTNQMTSNALDAILKAKGAEWTTSDYKAGHGGGSARVRPNGRTGEPLS